MATYRADDYALKGANITFTTLIAPGSTASTFIGSWTEIVWQYTIASMDVTVVVRAEGSVDDSSWFNLEADSEVAGYVDTTITANGTYAFHWVGQVNYVRFTFVSETTATDATIVPILKIGGIKR